MLNKMTSFLRKLTLALALLSVGFSAHAQFSFTPTIGAGLQPAESGFGAYIGVYGSRPLGTHFAFDSQLSFIVIGDDNGTYSVLNALAGIRIYFNQEGAEPRIYFNALLGPSFEREARFDFIAHELEFGYSGGLFAEIRRVVIGVSFDAPQSLLLKAGYVF